MRKQLVKTVTDILEKDSRVILLLGDIGVYGFREAFEKFPNRVFNIGILEQASVSLAAGLAIEGLIPVFHTIATFLVERALEQLKVDFGYQKLGGNFISVGGSYDYASLGATHHCPGDVQILKTIPNTQIFVPGHSDEFDNQFRTNYANGRLNYYRLSEQSNLYPLPEERLRSGKKGTIVSIGPMLDRVLEACDDLDVDVLYRNKVEPFNSYEIYWPQCSKTVVVEPFYEGTMARDVHRFVEQKEVLYIGVPRKFLTRYGTPAELNKHCGLTTSQIRERIKEFLNI